MYYRIPLIAVALLVAMTASAQTVNETRPYSGTTTNPCNGETITFSGSIHFHEATRVSPDGRVHFISVNTFKVSGTGQSTGWSYSISGSMKANAKFPTFPIMFRQRTKVISSGPADNFHATFAFHMNGNGQQTQATIESDCK